MNFEFSRQIFRKYSNIKFYKNSCSWNRAVSRGWKDGQTDMTKMIIVFRNFVEVSKNIQNSHLFSKKRYCARTMKVKAV